MVKKGDTLIEVLLAVGIFSMIAISVVAVMSGGTSSAQTALETTLAREEIDAQAEALRYIHDSYINDKNSGNTELPTVALWREIVNNEKVYVPSGDEDDKELLQYAPSSCPTNASDLPEGAFILDTRSLDQPNVAYKSAKTDPDVFAPAITFPRLVFGADSNNLIENSTNTMLTRAEGIYIIAVADRDTTTVLDVDGKPVNSQGTEVFRPAFFDFYIRTCWYGTDAETPSTISTVIRLHNPDVQTDYAYFNFSMNGLSSDQTNYLVFNNDYKNYLYEKQNIEKFWPWKHTEGWSFDGWCLRENVVEIEDGGTACRGGAYQVGDSFSSSEGGNFDFVPIFSHIKYTIEYDSNGSSWKYNNGQPQICWEDVSRGECVVQGDEITRSGYAFGGWCDGSVSSDGTCSGKTYQKGDIIYAPSGFPASRIIRLAAIWKERDEEITIYTQWTSNTDYDSYLRLSDPNSSGYLGASWNTTNPFATTGNSLCVTHRNKTYALATGNGDGRGGINNIYYERFVIHTLGGKDYYYSLRNWSNPGYIGNDITVTVSGPYLGTKTFKSTVKNNCAYWNVFAYQDGSIVERNTCTRSIEYPY